MGFAALNPSYTHQSDGIKAPLTLDDVLAEKIDVIGLASRLH